MRLERSVSEAIVMDASILILKNFADVITITLGTVLCI